MRVSTRPSPAPIRLCRPNILQWIGATSSRRRIRSASARRSRIPFSPESRLLEGPLLLSAATITVSMPFRFLCASLPSRREKPRRKPTVGCGRLREGIQSASPSIPGSPQDAATDRDLTGPNATQWESTGPNNFITLDFGFRAWDFRHLQLSTAIYTYLHQKTARPWSIVLSSLSASFHLIVFPAFPNLAIPEWKIRNQKIDEHFKGFQELIFHYS